MQNKGFLFIPDISGFSRFVEQSEVEHSRLIIQELLEVLIDANQMGLEVSEVEGDAILFYRFGGMPELEEVYRQVERMFCEFHRRLMAYHHRRYCYCKACDAAIGLTLKVVTHYGEFTGYNVRTFNKLIGKDVIIAHQLLKNDIERHEYWLVTTSLSGATSQPIGFADWMRWERSAKQTETGEVQFHYTQLGELKNQVTPDPTPQVDLTSATRVFSLSQEYATDIITLFHTTGDFNNRSQWQDGVKSVEEVGHFLPRVGMKCRCIMDNGEVVIYASSYSFSGERIEFTETDEQRRTSVRFTLEKLGVRKTRLTLDYYIRKSPFGWILFFLTRKRKTKSMIEKSMNNIQVLVREGKLPS